ncbi:MAG: biopolymer transporter ExbD [Gammaproteobacteria bacterium]|jgi:biopolymer transport protein ExbD|nr:biopolymer transporter ExbD [Gammaproteobacteria bacterium]MBK8990303.1 biopolymer transporter ExbD [Gammaproteobacteria bacterium]MBK9469133.1 biopolymer transporter ExbD [Gammaproteobacteria bacterium]MBP6481306.1 biopolymer transporter ExbD [Pseudomonadales bacterium]MBP7910792.1 biopolymer transporter ExbD [Pseudomonadales bacterium]
MIRLGRPAPRAKDHDDKLVPMINVIFLLLMFFLIAGNLKPLFSEEQLIPLSRSEALPARERIELSLSRDGVLTWGGEAVDAARLGARLRAQPDGVPEALSLRADARTQAAALLPVLDALRGIGVQRIAIVTLRR